MTNRPALTLLTIALFVAPGPADADAKEYLSVFQQSPVVQTVYLEQTQTELSSTFDAATSQGLRLVDINTYRKAQGGARYDSVWKPGSGYQLMATGHPLSSFIEIYIQETSSGKRLVSMSSNLKGDGERAYAASFRAGSGPHGLIVDAGKLKFAQDYKIKTLQGLRLVAVDTYLDPDGTRRFHSVYGTGSAFHDMELDMSLAELQAEIAAKQPARVRTLETYVDPDGVQRYLAVWEMTSPGTTKLFVSQTKSEFLTTYGNQTSNGYELVDLENLTYEAASWSEYGAGLAGAGGVPDLSLGAVPYLGQKVDIAIGNSSGAPTLCGFFAGLSPTSLPFAGGSLLVDPATSFYFPLPPGGVTLPVTMPFNVAFSGLDVYGQVAQQDLGAPEGISLSRGLKMTFGRLE